MDQIEDSIHNFLLPLFCLIFPCTTTNVAIGYYGATSTGFDERSGAVPDLEQYRSAVERTFASTKICSASCGFTRVCATGSTY